MRTAIACAALLLGLATAHAGEYEKGISAFRRAHYPESVSLLKPLAQRGDPYAQFAIAVMYDDGIALPQDFSRAISWYTRAAKAGHVDAQYMLGRIYGRGRGVKQDPRMAFLWFNLAAAGGHPFAPRLRDQQRSQVNRAERSRLEDEAVVFQARHPQPFSCKGQRCIYPRWTAKPRWNWLDLDNTDIQ